MKTLKNKKVLITCGPTWVPIDDTRVISNISSGKMGQVLARHCLKEGAQVTVLQGAVQQQVEDPKIRVRPFRYYDELKTLLGNELKKRYDIVLHAAAVSDYQMKKAKRLKISSSLSELTLTLKPTQKIIHQIKELNPGCLLVGFKLESKMTSANAFQKAQALFLKGRCDLVVANTLNANGYKGFIFDPSGSCLAESRTREGLAKALVKYVNAKCKMQKSK